MDSFRFLDASLDKLSTTLKSFPSLDANGIEDDLFKRKLAYSYEKGNNIESFYKPLKLSREDYLFYFETIISKFRGNNKNKSCYCKK